VLQLRVIAKSPLMPESLRPRADMPIETAQAMALEALAFLAEDPLRLKRFLDLTGLSVGHLRSDVAAPTVGLAVLEHLAADESLLLVFTANRAIAPHSIAPAIALLQAASR
jgi:Protein of unknown function (DUF3572)